MDGVDKPKLLILVRQPLTIALQEFTRLQDQLVLSAILAFCALSFIAILLARKIAAPLRAIRRALETPGRQLPRSRSYAEAELLTEVITEMRQLEQQDIQALEQLNRTLEQQVAERTQEMENVLQHAMNAFISLNEQGAVIAWNLQAARLFGWPVEQILGKPLPMGFLTQRQEHWLHHKIRRYQQTGTLPDELVREAAIEDVGGLLDLISPLEEQGILVRRSREVLEREIEQFSVVEREGMIIACAALYQIADSDAGELACLAVNPEYRHGRRGDELLERIETRARAQGLKTLFVLTTRTAHWFRERGFEPSSVERLPAARASLYNYQRNSKIFEKTL